MPWVAILKFMGSVQFCCSELCSSIHFGKGVAVGGAKAAAGTSDCRALTWRDHVLLCAR